ncbi:M55 family metallopeptidase [Streptomyces tateyamensis]|uniref:M55 family metallopeptidase n=1 Tax=Streptomyces tateyamensis TaxID=565073 RepID=UPI001FE83802|nr:M55 family metallopeptidase [Streptomyces tateyamensis]
MKVFLSSDMEGTAGVVDWEQCRPGGPEYGYYRELLQQEVNAAIEGAAEAGAREFLVNDSHSSMANLRPDALAHRARYLSGRHKPMYMMQGLDASYDAVFFVSYHGSMDGAAATLSHTYNPRAIAEVRLNGRPAGEAAINALVALGYGVPVVLITGDEVTAEQIEPFCPGIRAAVVKTSVTRYAADSLHPEQARELIRQQAGDAVRALSAARPPAITLPATLTVRFRNADLAELATWIGGVVREDGLTVSITGEDPIRLYRTFVTVVLLTRGIAE